jgi:hypothetical protein
MHGTAQLRKPSDGPSGDPVAEHARPARPPTPRRPRRWHREIRADHGSGCGGTSRRGRPNRTEPTPLPGRRSAGPRTRPQRLESPAGASEARTLGELKEDSEPQSRRSRLVAKQGQLGRQQSPLGDQLIGGPIAFHSEEALFGEGRQVIL